MADERPKGDRGGGIHVRGDLRIRDLTVTFNATTGEMVGSSGITELRTDIFHHWLRIAEQASDDSEAARRAAIEAAADDDEAFGAAVELEFQASMVAIAASAFAIDAFYASVVQHAVSRVMPCRYETDIRNKLVSAGFTWREAVPLALDADLSVALAVALVERGCPLATAIRIAT